MSLATPTNLCEMDNQQLAALYNQCFKSGHTNLFDPPGYKFGAALYIEREVFRRRLIACGWKPKDTTSLDFDTCLRFEIELHRQKFHRADSHYREYSNISVS